MPEKLKDLFFSRSFVDQLGDAVYQVYPDFDKNEFIRLVYDGTWEARELKDKMRHITRCLFQTLPADYPAALEILR